MFSRPIASGTISFGLVAIPVRMYAPIDSSKTIRFNQLHEKCGNRVRQQLKCPVCEEVVAREETVKGHEFAKGQYVLFTPEELEGLVVKPTHAIEISEFVPLKEIDPIYYEKSYYLGPNQGGEKPYRLLAQALQDTGYAALGKYAARGKQYIVLLRPFDQGMIMQQLYYADEIRSFKDVPLGEAETDPAELNLAKQLVGQTARDSFHPESFRDEIREKLLHLIHQKVEGQEVSAAPEVAPKAQIIDLMEALKASLAVSERAEKKTTKGRKPPQRSLRPSTVHQKKRKVAASKSGKS
jgi:DNA end-binding protein Ku